MTTLRRLAPLLVLCVAVVTPAALNADMIHNDRVRPLDPHIQELLHQGFLRSETFRALVTRLHGGNVVAYVRFEALPAGVHGRMSFLGSAAGIRYVVIALAADLDALRSIVILGHELRHVVEVLEQPQIVDEATFAIAYERASHRRRQLPDGRMGFDTIAAVHAGVAVSKEVAMSPLEAPITGTR